MDKDVIRGAMQEVLPILADCYGAARATTLSADHLEIRAHFTLTGRSRCPGTVIDANQLFDDNKKPLPSELDDCIRGTLHMLSPPLGDGETIEVDYPLVFSDAPPDGSGSGSAH